MQYCLDWQPHRLSLKVVTSITSIAALAKVIPMGSTASSLEQRVAARTSCAWTQFWTASSTKTWACLSIACVRFCWVTHAPTLTWLQLTPQQKWWHQWQTDRDVSWSPKSWRWCCFWTNGKQASFTKFKKFCWHWTLGERIWRPLSSKKSQTNRHMPCLHILLSCFPRKKDKKQHPSSPSPSTIIYYPFNPWCQKCHFNTQSCTKPSKKLPTSFVTTATTGTNSVTKLPNQQGTLRKILPHARTTETQDCQEQRTTCHWTFAKGKPPPIFALPYPTCRHLANVQKSGSVFLDSGGNWSLSRPKRLGQHIPKWTPLHLQCSSFLCGIQRHCQWKPKQQLCHQNNCTWSPLLLRLPNCSQKHSQQNLLPAHWHVYQGPCRETTLTPCHKHSTMHPTESKLGAQMVWPHQC